MRRFVLFLVVVIALTATGNSAEIVTFQGTKTAAEPSPAVLKAKLTKPGGSGPFPAVVMLHGCSGVLLSRDNLWAGRLAEWGYAAFQVDSFGPRGVKSVCADRASSSEIMPKRVRDAYDAKAYLSGLAWVDPNRIAVMGWSHGGWTTLEVLSEREREPFRSAIAFYPWCAVPMNDVNAPLLLLIGDADDWTLSKRCVSRMPFGQPTHEVTMKVYPGAYHGFDGPGADRTVQGSTGPHRLRYDKEAAEDAALRVKGFLAKYLK